MFYGTSSKNIYILEFPDRNNFQKFILIHPIKTPLRNCGRRRLVFAWDDPPGR